MDVRCSYGCKRCLRKSACSTWSQDACWWLKKVCGILLGLAGEQYWLNKEDSDDSLETLGNDRWHLSGYKNLCKKHTGKCVEGKRKSTMTSRRWRSSFLPNNGTAGDLLECICHCYLSDANDQEKMRSGGGRLPRPKLSQRPDNWQAPTSNCPTIPTVHCIVHTVLNICMYSTYCTFVLLYHKKN
jgi:hypothetical protein